MDKTTVSVRLYKDEYTALQALAQKDLTSMSSVLRRLLRDETERVLLNGTTTNAVGTTKENPA